MPLFLIGILGGTLLAAALKAIFDIGGNITQNQYNAPKATLKRLRKAGLPLSYMYKGNVAQQSQSPQLSIEPTLGTLPKLQGSKLQVDTQEQLNETQAKDFMSGIWHTDPETGELFETTNRVEQERAKSFINNYESELKKIELDVERDAFGKNIPQDMKKAALEKAQNQVKNLLAQAGLMEQLKKIRGFEEKMNDSLTKNLDSLPQWISALLKIILLARFHYMQQEVLRLQELRQLKFLLQEGH